MGSSLVRFYIGVQNALLLFVNFTMFRRAGVHEPKTIVVYRTARLGDFIVAIPALAVLRRRFPNARIVLLTTVSTAPRIQEATRRYTSSGGSLPWLSLAVPALLNEAVVLNMTNWRTGLREARRLIMELRPDCVFVLPFSGEDGIGSLKKMLFLRLAGATVPLYGWRVRASIKFLRDVQFRSGRFEHQIWGPLHALMECPLIPRVREEDIEFPLDIDPEAKRWSRQLWAAKGWSDRPIVAIFPGGTFLHKRWPQEKFIEVCRALNARHGAVFVILGANTDRSVCTFIADALSPELCLNLAGETSVMQLAALFGDCVLFIGNDSGPAHLAAATGCRCLTIFSSIVYPGFWEPIGKSNRSLRGSVACEHCFCETECPLGTRECINKIEVAEVLDLCNSVAQKNVGTVFEYAV